MNDQTELREKIRLWVAEKRGTLKGLSRALNKNDAYMQQFIARNIPHRLPKHVEDKLLEILENPNLLVPERDATQDAIELADRLVDRLKLSKKSDDWAKIVAEIRDFLENR